MKPGRNRYGYSADNIEREVRDMAWAVSLFFEQEMPARIKVSKGTVYKMKRHIAQIDGR